MINSLETKDKAKESKMREHQNIINEFAIKLKNKSHNKKILLGSVGAWTRMVKESFVEIGLNRGYQVYCNGLKNKEKNKNFHCSEYLCDLVWCYYGNIFKSLGKRVPKDKNWRCILAMECEWNNNNSELVQDFCKILDVFAPMKVMIFPARKHFRKKELSKDHIFDTLISVCKNHSWWAKREKGEWLMVICLEWDYITSKGMAISKLLLPDARIITELEPVQYL